MQKGYFSAAWGDLTHSPKWFVTMLKLSLLGFIPIFGAIVINGYLYGWARDIAWNVHRPLPRRIFANEDGALYKRGFFILVIGFVFSLAPFVFYAVSSLFFAFSSTPHGASAIFAMSGSFISVALVVVLTIFASFFTYAGSMRAAIYGTISSGFQLGKIWSMIRYDFTGLLRVFAFDLVALFIFTIVGSILGFLIFFPLVLMVSAGVSQAYGTISASIAIALIAFVVLMVLLAWVLQIGTVIITALIARALGYWTRQFEVDQWGGQDDLMPFERRMHTTPGNQAYYPDQVTPQQQVVQQPTSGNVVQPQQTQQPVSGSVPQPQQPTSGNATQPQQVQQPVSANASQPQQEQAWQASPVNQPQYQDVELHVEQQNAVQQQNSTQQQDATVSEVAAPNQDAASAPSHHEDLPSEAPSNNASQSPDVNEGSDEPPVNQPR